MEFLWFLEQFRNPITNAIFQFFTYFGEQLLVIAIVCVLFWCLNKKIAIRIGLSYFVAGLLVQCLKIVFCIPRPWILDETFKPVSSAVGSATGYSFPSGHSQSAASIWGTIGSSFKKNKRNLLCAICILIAFLTGFSRMFLGVHTPKDVAVGLLIGFVVAFLVTSDKIEQFIHKNQSVVSLVFALISILLFLFATYRIAFENVNAKEGIDCCKSAGAGFGFAISWFFEEKWVKWEPNKFFEKLNLKNEKQLRITQVIVAVVGIAIVIGLKVGLKKLLGSGMVVGALQYAILVSWIVFIYPAILMKYAAKKKN